MPPATPHTGSETIEAQIWQLLRGVPDPEVPVLSVVDLGMVRTVSVSDGHVEIAVTPTYSGCPAADAIGMAIRLKLLEHGFGKVAIKQVLSPAWTTDWMTEAGKQKLKTYGIAPPNPKQHVCNDALFADEAVPCPRCDSFHTELVSRFASTACKSLYRCLDCREAFEYFKCH